MNVKVNEGETFMLLAMAPFGEKLKIQKLKGNDSQKKHLENLGFVQDAEIEVISANGEGLIVSVKGSRIALGAELSRRIQVLPLQMIAAPVTCAAERSIAVSPEPA